MAKVRDANPQPKTQRAILPDGDRVLNKTGNSEIITARKSPSAKPTIKPDPNIAVTQPLPRKRG